MKKPSSATGRRARGMLALPLLLLTTASATSQTYSIASQPRQRASADTGWFALHRAPSALLADHRRLTSALAALRPHRKGIVDAYVLVAALDADPVFGREAQEAARVLTRRYDAAGRTIVMTADSLNDSDPGAPASPTNLALALARVGELADPAEDVVIFYTTSHGSAPEGLEYRDPVRGAGAISPDRLAAMLVDAGVSNRLLILSACYSGIFVPRLASASSVVITAAAADRSSFGCEPGNDWTFFGDALLNRAFRKAQPLTEAFAEARASVAGWEESGRLQPSNPQVSIGDGVAKWLVPLERRMPAAPTQPVGRSPAAGAGGTR